MDFSSVHTAVMVDEAIGYLALKRGDVVLDCTVGAAGHSKEILRKITPSGKLIGLDIDAEILNIAEKELAEFKNDFILRQRNFRELNAVLTDLKIDKVDPAISKEIFDMIKRKGGVDGLLFDLGVSSYQLESPQRGFSFNKDGPLDMRMGLDGKTAYDLVNYLGKEDMADIFFKLGQERYARRIAEAIISQRKARPVRTSLDLSGIILRAMPRNKKWQKIHPATRVFQALRIAVNDELGSLEEGLKKALDVLAKGARICVISFHSLEDRIVKNNFKTFEKEGKIKILTKKPVKPTNEEISRNPRSRSAKLRAAVKL
jgi:16S rRNA (cytosine1402-N4)-methyltransferase